MCRCGAPTPLLPCLLLVHAVWLVRLSRCVSSGAGADSCHLGYLCNRDNSVFPPFSALTNKEGRKEVTTIKKYEFVVTLKTQGKLGGAPKTCKKLDGTLKIKKHLKMRSKHYKKLDGALQKKHQLLNKSMSEPNKKKN